MVDRRFDRSVDEFADRVGEFTRSQAEQLRFVSLPQSSIQRINESRIVDPSDEFAKCRPRGYVRHSLPATDVRRGGLRATDRLGDLGQLDVPEPRQDLPSEQLRVVGRVGIGLVPTPTAPGVGDDVTRLAWPLHELTELSLGEACQATEERPCVRAD